MTEQSPTPSAAPLSTCKQGERCQGEPGGTTHSGHPSHCPKGPGDPGAQWAQLRSGLVEPGCRDARHAHWIGKSPRGG